MSDKTISVQYTGRNGSHVEVPATGQNWTQGEIGDVAEAVALALIDQGNFIAAPVATKKAEKVTEPEPAK